MSLSLSGASDKLVSVTVQTTDWAAGASSATAGEDYTALDTSLEFQPGDQTKTVGIPIIDDTRTEPLEFFGLRSTRIRNARIPETGVGNNPGVTIIDNDTAGIVLSKTSLSITEGGAGETYTVTLATQPSAEVEVLIRGAVGSDLDVVASRLTFTTANWNTAQTVTVSSEHDDDTEPDTVTLTHRATSTDSAYDNLAGDSVTVRVADDDVPEVIASPTKVGVAEGGTNTYTLKLRTQPNSSVTVTINDPTDNTEVTAAPDSVTFTTASWDTAQTVTVSAMADADSVNDDATITHTAAGAQYEGVTGPDVAVKVVEELTVEYDPTTYTVPESDDPDTPAVTENEVEVTLTLSADPHRTVTVPLTATAQGTASAEDYTAPESVTFTTGRPPQRSSSPPPPTPSTTTTSPSSLVSPRCCRRGSRRAPTRRRR